MSPVFRASSSSRNLAKPIINNQDLPLGCYVIDSLLNLFDESALGSAVTIESSEDPSEKATQDSMVLSSEIEQRWRSSLEIFDVQAQECVLLYLVQFLADRPSIIHYCRYVRIFDVLLFSKTFLYSAIVSPASFVNSPSNAHDLFERVSTLRNRTLLFLQYCSTLDSSAIDEDVRCMLTACEHYDTNTSLVIDLFQSLISICRHRRSKMLLVFRELDFIQSLVRASDRSQVDSDPSTGPVALSLTVASTDSERKRQVAIRFLTYVFSTRQMHLVALSSFVIVNLSFNLMRSSVPYNMLGLRLVCDIATAYTPRDDITKADAEFLEQELDRLREELSSKKKEMISSYLAELASSVNDGHYELQKVLAAFAIFCS